MTTFTDEWQAWRIGYIAAHLAQHLDRFDCPALAEDVVWLGLLCERNGYRFGLVDGRAHFQHINPNENGLVRNEDSPLTHRTWEDFETVRDVILAKVRDFFLDHPYEWFTDIELRERVAPDSHCDRRRRECRSYGMVFEDRCIPGGHGLQEHRFLPDATAQLLLSRGQHVEFVTSRLSLVRDS